MLRVIRGEAPPELGGLLELDRVGRLTFRSRENEMNFSGGLYGGQMLCQGLAAALQTVDGKTPHSLHAYFLASGDVHQQLTYEVEATRDGAAVPVGYARLLNEGGEFVAEVPLGADGGFRFFAAPGSWTVRVLAPGGVNTDRPVTAETGRVAAVEVSV